MTESDLIALEKWIGHLKREIGARFGFAEHPTWFNSEKRKIQQTNHTLWVTIPQKYCELVGLKKGDTVTLFWRKKKKEENNLTLEI